MAWVSYRRVGDKWHVRFRAKGKKEIIKTYPGTLYEKTIIQKVGYLKEQIALGHEDPWQGQGFELSAGTVLNMYLEENLESGNWAEHTTHKTNKNVLTRMLAPVEGEAINEISADHWQQLFNDLPGGAYTKKGDRGRLNSFLKYAHDKGYMNNRIKVDLPMKYVLEMRNRSSIKYITWQQLDDVCAAHRWIYRQNHLIYGTHSRKDPEFYPDLYFFIFYSLLRSFEVPKLKAKHLKGNKLTVQGKGRRTDIITLPPPALDIAQKYVKGKSPDEYIFCSDMNRPRKHLGRAVELALGPDHPSKGFHQLRHSGCVYYISMGKPIQFISKLLRHKSIDVTLRVYSDVLPDKMEEVFSDVRHRPV